MNPLRLICPTCHRLTVAGNRIVEGPVPGFDGVWVQLLFSCGLHVWAWPVDPAHPLRQFGF